jgi:hypothetical protein
MTLAAAINAAVVPMLANPPGPGRQRRTLTTIVMSVDDAPDQPAPQ